MSVEIMPCTEPDELYHRLSGDVQPCYIHLSLKDGRLWAAYDLAAIKGRSELVETGYLRRYRIPVLTGDAANRVTEEIRPLAGRIVVDWQEVWNGDNWVARLGEDAVSAEEAIAEHLNVNSESTDRGFPDSDLVTVWELEGYSNGDEVAEYGITASTTDERLSEVASLIIAGMVEVSPGAVVVLDGVNEYLCGLRADLAAEAPV